MSAQSGLDSTTVYAYQNNPLKKALRPATKVLVVATLGLIYVGGLVKSHEAGLSVPDWPTTYNHNMFTYPPSQWVGGILYEHGHRLFASAVGLLTLLVVFSLSFVEERIWVRLLGFAALIAVVIQGVLGGVTVLWGLPMPVSVAHGVLAQTFLVMAIIIAYSQSREYRRRAEAPAVIFNPGFVALATAVTALVFLQLVVGAIMRHMGAGLAIHDFPTSGGYIIPPFNQEMLDRLNAYRYDIARHIGQDIIPITMSQAIVHFMHRVGAVIVTLAIGWLLFRARRTYRNDRRVVQTAWLMAAVVLIQFTLGALVIFHLREPVITSVHVVTGAALLGLSALLVLRTFPARLRAPAAEPADEPGLSPVAST